MTQHINEEGVPLRGDGTPFPADPSQWSPEEREYLATYFLGGELKTTVEHEQVALADVPDINEHGDHEGGSYA